jgi:hypothetical protein
LSAAAGSARRTRKRITLNCLPAFASPGALLPFTAVALAVSVPSVLHGECIYPPRIAGALANAAQVPCDSVEIGPQGSAFRRRERETHRRFFFASRKGPIMTETSN